MYALIISAQVERRWCASLAGRCADVLRRIANHPASRLHELLSWHWRKSSIDQVNAAAWKSIIRGARRMLASMADAGRDTGDSKYFRVLGLRPHLNGMHTVIGRVTDGLDVTLSLEQGDHIKSIRFDA